MMDQAYFERLTALSGEGQARAENGRRTELIRLAIVQHVQMEDAQMWRSARMRRAVAERAAQAAAAAGYIGTAALATIALTTSVECAVAGLPARTWAGFALAALLSLVIGVLAHAAYDAME